MTWLEPEQAQFVDTKTLRVAYHELGPPSGPAVVLSHGFPYDVQAYAHVGVQLAQNGWRVLIPYLRGYGPTRFLNASTPRSGEQAVLGQDLLAFLDALAIERAVLGGYDWGGRAACIVAALWPTRVQGLVTVNGYNIQNIAASAKPQAPEDEHRHWYQYYFHSERGAAGLAHNRAELCKLLWSLWSPNWSFTDDTYEQTVRSFDNPDFVSVVIHSYRHRYALVNGDPQAQEVEDQLSNSPSIIVPTVSLDGAGDGVMSARGTAHHARKFTGPYEHRVIPSVGHNLPQEAPDEFVQAVESLR
ncbi:MAG: pimeloyl-ACP methyl ester carboxylesterase [Gammaproteobacteria bacterium]|jgi:pimeloyl-ACP methyl ester carboxylesterase